MFEDLRNDGDLSPLFQEQEETDPMLDGPAKKKGGLDGFNLKFKFGRKFLGMTAFQRFVVSLAIMVMVSVVSLALLIVTGSIALF
ncbi:MAG: hypothetical protein WA821_03640 [Anaerolineales bacterium]